MSMRYKTFLISIISVSSSLHKVIMKKPNGFTFKPGQFINIMIGADLVRSYSLCSDPEANELELLVKFPGGSRARIFFEEALGDQTSIDIMGAFGRYRYQDTQFEKVHIVTGAGMGPNLSMIKFWARTCARQRTSVFWGLRSFEAISDREYWSLLAESHPHLRLWICLSQESDPDKMLRGAIIEHGRVLDVIESNMKDFSDKEFYVCGQPEMISSVVEYLRKKGVDDSLIFYETFNAASDRVKK